MTEGRRLHVELPEPFLPGMKKLVFDGESQILIVNADGVLRAIENSCPHAGSSLLGGQLSGNLLRCPSHGLKIDLVSGCLAGSKTPGVRVYPIEPVPEGAVVSV